MRRVVLRSSLPGGINMTPLIDVILQLIIFFLCVRQQQKAEISEALALPQARSKQVRLPEDSQESLLIVNLLPNGTVKVGGREAPDDQLPGLLAQRKAKVGGELEVWVRADESVPYRFVEPILRNCAELGIWNVSFKVLKETDNESGSP